MPAPGDPLARKRATAKSKPRTQRALWNGAISFGLVNIPVEMFSAETHDELDFTMLDKRDFSPIGYKRISKETGKEVKWDNIVKGYEYEKGRFVVLSDEDLRQANVEATRTIDIRSFVDVAQIPITSYEKPYYLAPERGGEKAYVLLRETLRKTGKVALAQVVIRVRQHLAALLPFDSVITLITLRYPAELKMPEDLDLPDASPKRAGVTDNEVKMALELVKSMSDDWDPASYHDSYRDDVLTMIDKKIKSGKVRAVAEPPREHDKAGRKSADVIDLMALLKKSIDGKQPKKRRAAS
ncbi:MAG TPA: Ku protein [Burkholderiales bacterium]|nr:Ku protein [Burkholderiales bacterium]